MKMAKQQKSAIQPTREQDYPGWYQQVVRAADLAEPAPVRGCMVIKPWGYAIWQHLQHELDQRFKATGHANAYFPIFIPMSYLEQEAEHVEGFAKECAVVTHHRLEPDPGGGLRPAAPLEEPLIVRPTSETIIGATYAKWVKSYRDLPILLNQWANVVRWEMRPRLFLRTTEFLWQEGHTVHASQEEAEAETRQMLDVYEEVCHDVLAMPVIKGEKTATERFPGAVATYTIEAMMQDRKALQSGTSHFLGQNFSKAQQIKFQNKNGQEEYAWTTSWGVSTRLVGGLVMTHSDDDGLVLPPRLAPVQIRILPIFRNDEDRSRVLQNINKLKRQLEEKDFAGQAMRIDIDDRDIAGGEKTWQAIKKGVPIRLEIGPRDVDAASVCCVRRDQGVKDKQQITQSEFVSNASSMLADIQSNLFKRAQHYRDQATKEINSFEEFEAFFASDTLGGFALCHWHDCDKANETMKRLKVTIRCIPHSGEKEAGSCIFSGEQSPQRVIFAKAY